MADTRPVRTQADYEAALARIDEIMDADPDSPDARELDVLVDLIELYESRREPMGHPTRRRRSSSAWIRRGWSRAT